MRKVIAERLTQSTSSVPHYYVTMSLNVDKLNKLRDEINSSFADKKDKITMNDLFIKAAAIASAQVPETRSTWDGDKGVIKISSSVDISFAVDTGKGLITPIVPGADKLRLKQISTLSKDLIEKARANKLKPEEYIGGTMSISNMGMLGVKQFTAIINPPQSCILAIASQHRRLTADMLTTSVIDVTLSSDHRIVDGAVASRYLTTLRSIVDNPVRLIV